VENGKEREMGKVLYRGEEKKNIKGRGYLNPVPLEQNTGKNEKKLPMDKPRGCISGYPRRPISKKVGGGGE